MPSNRNPAAVVNPGPGRLAAGTITESAFIFGGGGGGGGSGAALHAHIVDPMDAHMASAIGVNPTDPSTGRAILHTAGGVVDGESVLDFIEAAMDLWPDPPDRLGWDNPSIPNSGRTIWGTLDEVGTGIGTAVTGAFARGTDVAFTHHVIESGTMNPMVYGMIYPADRGVLAFYWTPNGDYADPGATLLSALWLGSAPAPAGIPNANFFEVIRTAAQFDYSATNVGIDNIFLSNRVPYLKDYSPYIVPWTAYDYNFYRYQLASYVQTPDLVVGVGDVGSWLWVHWREGYATSLAAIQPSVLGTQLNSNNCYSAVPSLGDFDADPVYYVNRHNVYRDASSLVVPFGTITSAISGGFPVPFSVLISGVGHFNGLNLRIDFTATTWDLWNSTFFTASWDVPPDVPAGFSTAYCPLEMDFSDFGASSVPAPYYNMRKVGTFVNYSATNAPQPGDNSEYLATSYTPSYTAPHTPPLGEATIKATLRKPFQTAIVADLLKYMFNSWNQVGTTKSTGIYEDFVDEKYRYTSTVTPAVLGKPMIPVGGDDFNSTVAFVAGGPDLQVVGSILKYPQTDYSVGYAYIGPNYAAVFAADPANHLRRYLRAFDTGSPRTTGKIRLRGLAFSAFQTTPWYTGDEFADHPGGAIVQVRVAGSTEWLDLGRAKGDPDMLLTDFRGCMISVETSGSDTIVTYDTTLPTVDDGTGAFPIFVRVTFAKSTGFSHTVDELEWLAP